VIRYRSSGFDILKQQPELITLATAEDLQADGLSFLPRAPFLWRCGTRNLWPAAGDGSPAHSCSAGSPVVAVLVSARIALITDSRSRPQRSELGDGNVVDVHTAGLSSFQCPSKMTSTPPSVTLMAV
jgi:hypothetical protein